MNNSTTNPNTSPGNDLVKMVGQMAAHLVDAMFMLENIERNRNAHPMAYSQAQYIAKGLEIRKFLIDNGLLKP